MDKRCTTMPAWAGPAPVIPEAQIKETITADLVVVGSGNAGLIAAVAATMEGAKVAVLESQTRERYAMYGLADVGVLNSEWGKKRGLPAVDPVEFVAEWQHRTQNRSDPRLIGLYARHSGEMLDWLLGLLDPSYAEQCEITNFPSPGDKFDGTVSGFKSWLGTCELRRWRAGARSLVEKCEGMGSQWYFGNRARVLEKDDTGAVIGVIAQTGPESYVRYLGRRGVILAAGDFGANKAMYQALYNEIVQQYESYGLDTSELRTKLGRDGDGQLMAVWAGGSMEPGPYASIYPTAMPVMADDPGMAGFVGTSYLRLDQNGKRYSDEGIMGVYGIVHRSIRMGPGEYYAVYDSQWPEYFMRQCNEHFMNSKRVDQIEMQMDMANDLVARGPLGNIPGRRPAPPRKDGKANPGAHPEGLDMEEMEAEAAKNVKMEPNQWAANSLEELADYAGFTGEVKANFLASVARYNQMCYQGKDEDFGKDPKLLMPIDKPPFFITKSRIQRPDVGLVALNGVITDENQAVLDKNYKPIPGLYATGTNGGGKFFMQYSSLMSGCAIGSAMTLGMLLGRQVAALPDRF